MKAILIPTDFSESSFNAALWAVNLSNTIQISSILLYHSKALPSRATELPLVHKQTKTLLEGFKERLIPHVKKGTGIETYLNDSLLIDGVSDLVQRHKVELIVMSTTGKGRIERAIAGSNTLHIISKSSIPVILIPENVKFEEIRKVALATDLNEVTKFTPDTTVKWFVKELKAQLLIVNVWFSEEPDPDVNSELATLQRMFESEQPEYHYINVSNIKEGLLEFATCQQVQIISVIGKKHGFLQRLFHKSVTKDFALKTYLPIIIFNSNCLDG
ncbi:universal stress protein [Desertivirga arenae]|uniref:universal stress protein n=1 Tax=Desertivirga arenae TaxID=2810309 RepID=UPI001A96DB95|nr:universal stress protein [Pedobacter sp. SYSU D00823]